MAFDYNSKLQHKLYFLAYQYDNRKMDTTLE